MFSFVVSLVALVAGYFIYGRVVEKVFGVDSSRKTPAITKADGVDYIPMPAWKVYMIQFLNIAGTGPIFGAIMGAKFGPSAYLWIVFGCIFAGAVHDYMTGMLSIRNNGAGLPDLVGEYLGKGTKTFILAFSIIVLMLVGTVFVFSPALILGDIAGDGSKIAIMAWVGVIFLYYLLATLMPIDKIIGRIYPVFSFALLFMAVALMVCLFVKWPVLPEIWDGLGNLGESKGLLSGQPVFPCLFITIACGAVSGFHATQSPLMARCVSDEKLGRPVFYGAMITEGIVALIWATVASWFFYGGGAAEVGSGLSAAAPEVVVKVSEGWLGILGGILAILGVVAAPITSGDTAFRSARLIVADFLHLPQKPIRNRLIISIPLFILASFLLWYNIADEDGFNVIWRYFGWANQTLAVFMLWTATAYLVKYRGGMSFMLTLLPAAFMTAVCVTYLCVAKIGLNLPVTWNWYIGISTFVLSLAVFSILYMRRKQN
ncbi:MAG: carbon starvation protein A [Bacteroides sp.]|nr:carbon starvation protein A [Bacteroides sp.]MDY2973243.1 carbon starvation protein A [Candidatus Cryptobacteroides sp.]